MTFNTADLALNGFQENSDSYFVAELSCIMNTLYSVVQENIFFQMLTSMKGQGGHIPEEKADTFVGCTRSHSSTFH